jgi:hypothetical protein
MNVSSKELINQVMEELKGVVHREIDSINARGDVKAWCREHVVDHLTLDLYESIVDDIMKNFASTLVQGLVSRDDEILITQAAKTAIFRAIREAVTVALDEMGYEGN